MLGDPDNILTYASLGVFPHRGRPILLSEVGVFLPHLNPLM